MMPPDHEMEENKERKVPYLYFHNLTYIKYNIQDVPCPVFFILTLLPYYWMFLMTMTILKPCLNISKMTVRKRRNSLVHSSNGNIRKKLLLYHWNVGSSRLENKMQHLELFVKEHRPSLLGVSEANMTKDTNAAEVELEGYNLVTTCAFEDPLQLNSRLVVYVADDLNFRIRKDLMSESCSSIWIHVTASNGKKYLCGFGYREFQIWGRELDTRTETEQFKRWETLIDQTERAMSEGSDCVLLGDLNVDYKTWKNPQYFAGRLIEAFESKIVPLGAFQLVTEDTRTRTGGQGTILDHIWANCPDITSNVTVGNQGPSDHKPTGVVLGSCNHTLGETMVCKRSMTDFDEAEYQRRLTAADLGSVLDEADVNKAVDKFTEIVGGVMEEMAPKKLVQVRKNFAPWVRKETLTHMKIRDQAAKSKETGGYEEDIAFRKIRNEVNRMIKKDKTVWEEKAIKASEEDKTGRLLWKFAKKKMFKSKSGPPKMLQSGGRLLQKPREIAEAQADFYSSKIDKINQDLEAAKATAGDPLEILRMSLDSWNTWSETKPSLSFLPISLADTRRLLSETSSSSTEGFDNISSNAIRAAGEVMIPVIRHLVNLSLVSGVFPASWRKTKIKPLFKGKGQATAPENFRPIAILAATSKILEKAATEQVTRYFVGNHLINENHHAYQTNRSTTTALQHLVDNINELLERGETGVAVILDMSAAFDSVNVELLCQKLSLYGLDLKAVNWMRSYLNNREFSVEIGGVTGQLRKSTTGVPQGSVLGPVLFTIFTNELPSVVQHHCPSCRLEPDRGRCGPFSNGCDRCGSTTTYADDVTHIFGERDMRTGREKMKNAVALFTNFLTANSLKLNDEKTHTLQIMTRQRRVHSQEGELDVVFGGKLVKPTEKEKLLGCWIHRNLSWRSQILEGQGSIRGKILKKLGELWRLGSGLNQSSRIKLANGSVMSLLMYAAPVWGGESSSAIHTLQVIQNKAARWCLAAGRRTRVKELMTRCGWMSVTQLVKYTSLISLWKTVFLDVGQYWRKRILRSGDGRLRSTGQGSLVSNFQPWMEITKTSWRWRSIDDWNALPPAVRQDTNLRGFKTALRSWILENVPTVPPRKSRGLMRD